MWRPCGTFDTVYEKDIAIIRTRAQWIATLLGFVVLAVLPFVLSGPMIVTVNLVAISAISAVGLQILVGMTGQISLGQGAFMGTGAYTLMVLMNHYHWSFWIALPAGVLVSGVLGLCFGLPSLRIKGFYLAMATLAAQFIIPWAIVNVRPDLTGGTDTITIKAPVILGLSMAKQEHFYYLALVFAVIAVYCARNLQRTRVGRAFIAIRDNDLAAEIMGVEVYRYKLLSFFICSLYAGLAGGLWAVWALAVNIDSFTLYESIWYLGMIVVGGLGSVPGAVFGVIFIRGVELIAHTVGPWFAEIVPNATFGSMINIGASPFIFGLVLLLFLIFEPRGLAHRWELIKHFYRRWPFAY